MTLSIARRHAGTTARSRTFFGLFEHTRREGTKTRRKTAGSPASRYFIFSLLRVFVPSRLRVLLFAARAIGVENR
jgi:hypothetical protein